MNLDIGGIEDRTIVANIRSWPRIIRSAHRSTPADTGYGSSRFSSPSKSFRVLYAAQNFNTAFSEAVIRDRFVNKSRKYLYRPMLEDLAVTEISSVRELSLLDFRGPAAHELGIDTDSKGARSHDRGQEFAEALHSQTSIDGLIFDSRMTGGPCLAIFDRAFLRIEGRLPRDIMNLSAFWDEIDKRSIIIRRKRGLGRP